MASSRPPLSPAEIGNRAKAQFGDDVVAEEVFGHPVLTVTAERYVELARFLRDDADLDCDYFDFLTAVDWRPKGRGYEVVAHVHSTGLNQNVRFKVACDAEDPHCPTISEVWPGANWCEREAWELFGVVFDEHPHLVKLVLPEQFEGFPLRKDFELISRVVKPWPGESEGAEE